MNDQNYPWVILVPKLVDASEIYLLNPQQRQQLDAESSFLAQTLMTLFEGYKLNVAALGNVVRQLHVHHVVRFENDPAWPAPVWGKLPAQTYSKKELVKVLEKLSPISEKTW